MIKKFKPFGEDLRDAIAAAWTQQHNKWVREKRALSQQEQFISTSNIMYDVTIDLFEALGNRNYPHLQTISCLADIRLYNFQVINGCTIYQYEIDKISSDKIAISLQKKLRDNLNRDIIQAQRQIVCVYGADWLSVAHPYLYSGLYIMSIKDIGHSIILDVVTHIQP